MWAIAGVLLGATLLASVLGFHLGPHGHVAGAVLGAFAAAWLIAIAVTSGPSALFWTLFGADFVLTAGMGVLARNGLRVKENPEVARRSHVLASEGVAVTPLTPSGTVRVRGETWSATSMNGDVQPGEEVQIIGVDGVHLEVWREEKSSLDEGVST